MEEAMPNPGHGNKQLAERVASPAVFDSQNTLVAIFSDAQPKSWRCINNSSSSLCMSSDNRGDVSSVCALKPGTWEWVGGHESSIVAEWGLVCDRRFLAAVPASMFFIGSLRGICCIVLATEVVGRKWGRSKEALNVLRKFARCNGKTLPENLCLANPSNPKEGGENEALTKTCTKESLWRMKWAAKRMITVMIAGFGVGFVYYGVQLNVENLNFNLYFSVGINALMEILAIIFGTILLGLTSRRLLFSLSAFLAGISCLLCIIFTHGKHGNKADKSRDGSWAQLIIEGVGFMVASIAYDVLYIYCVELFPTNVRNFALSQSRLSLMLGASIAPLLVVVGRETKNAPLYDSLKQQEEKEKHRDVGQSNNIQA
ncbi:SOLUTE CARRIER FAMILY 22 MEMBER [Salix koriyanagi]|uniref:SOLUTE CARRIER FAMILY 22 MEMBER n=1 Tax=Salix koriyanagi TaxID=2511006 RepID=A0A9Q0PGJ3_9ROSI|nr:SOLUTE CARRIER FAMILY 22 MEMBER [Salix koriyanagi]